MLSYKTGSFPTGVSTLLLTLPVLTGERSQTYIKHRKPLCKAVFAHSLDILRLNYRHSRNLRHHSISLQYAFTRKNYYTALRCGIQAFFEIFKIEFAIKILHIFVHINQSYLSVLFALSVLVFNHPMLMPYFPSEQKKISIDWGIGFRRCPHTQLNFALLLRSRRNDCRISAVLIYFAYRLICTDSELISCICLQSGCRVGYVCV